MKIYWSKFRSFQKQPELYKDFLGSIITVGAKTDFDRFFELNFKLLDSSDNEIKCRATYLLEPIELS